MLAVVTVIGRDRVGIIAGVSRVLSEHDVNILDISQTILENMFTMIMRVDLTGMQSSLQTLSEALDEEGHRLGLNIRVQRQEIFDAMHQI